MDDQFEYEPVSEEAELEEVVEESSGSSFNILKEVGEWITTFAVAFAIVFLIKGFLFDVVKVDGPSMYPTLHDKDRLIVTKLGYEPQQGDIVILDATYKKREAYYADLEARTGESYNALEKLFDYKNLPEHLQRRYYVKRIIAMPGQTVDIIEGKVYVDGVQLDEPYYDGLTPITDMTVQYPVTVEEGMVFVMGDNRPQSKDSRSSDLGQVPIDALFGKSQLRILPLSSFGLTK